MTQSYDVKTYRIDRLEVVEAETIRGLSLGQMIALTTCLKRCQIKHMVIQVVPDDPLQ